MQLNQFDTIGESTTPCTVVSDMSFVRNIDIQINERLANYCRADIF